MDGFVLQYKNCIVVELQGIALYCKYMEVKQIVLQLREQYG